MSLPIELICMIIKKCDVYTVIKFLLVNKDLHQEAKKNLHMNMFGDKSILFRSVLITYRVTSLEKILSFKLVNNPITPKMHREDGPCLVVWYNNGRKKYEEWRKNGDLHREEFGDKAGPAFTYWDENGNKEYKTWYQDGKFHRENGPAIIDYCYNGKTNVAINEEWFLNGMCDRRNRTTLPKHNSFLVQTNADTTETNASISNLPTSTTETNLDTPTAEMNAIISSNLSTPTTGTNATMSNFEFILITLRNKLGEMGSGIEPMPAVIKRRDDGSVYYEAWYRENFMYRENGLPVIVLYYKTGRKYMELWYENERPPRDGLHKIKYYPNGEKKLEIRYRNRVKEISHYKKRGIR